MSEKALEEQEKVAKEPKTTAEVSQEKFKDLVENLTKEIDAEEHEMNGNEHFNTSFFLWLNGSQSTDKKWKKFRQMQKAEIAF